MRRWDRRDFLGLSARAAVAVGFPAFSSSNTSVTGRATAEPILEPDLPIVDAHHHLWLIPPAVIAELQSLDTVFGEELRSVFRDHGRYLLDEFLSDAKTGHNMRASVYVQAGAMLRAGGPDAMKPVGEVEFANGIAAMSASGLYGDIRVCAGIVGQANLMLGDAVEGVLHAEIEAGDRRYRGIRVSAEYDPDPKIYGFGIPHVLKNEKFRSGFKKLGKLGLSADVILLEPVLPELIDLARAFPDTPIILNHVGVPIGVASYAGQRAERFPIWRDNIRTLARCENVAVKLGGLGGPYAGLKGWRASPPLTSEQLAAEWKPYIESCIEAFGVHRSMFESDFPVDAEVCSYAVLWNAFKRLTANASKDEKAALYSGTATKIYRLEL
jgi:predicted TIM-barrel fold metal-dependent hydrolase